MRKDFCRKLTELFGVRKRGDQGVALFEVNTMCSSHLAYAYLANSAFFENARLVGFSQFLATRLRTRIGFIVRRFLRLGCVNIYQAFGVHDFMLIKLSRSQKKWVGIFVEEFNFATLSKRDLERFSIDGCHLGDLIYDQYIASAQEPTVNISSERFRETFTESISIYKFWVDYFSENEVRGISVSHSVYNLAIPLRVALSRNVPVFQVSTTLFFRMSRELPYAFCDFFSFRKSFLELDGSTRRNGLAMAKTQLDKRFGGEVGVDMSYSKKSAFGERTKEPVLRPSDRPKILIAAHCFFDSPHPFGINVFPDFYEWLLFLGEFATGSDYDWYIKVHPDFIPQTKAVIEDLAERFPVLSVLPPGTSHLQLVDEGISCVLTVYGTVGLEYAALGVPVINASSQNFSAAYDFNYHASTVEEYTELLSKVPREKFTVNIDDVYEYYYMRFLSDGEPLFSDLSNDLKDREYTFQFTEGFYDLWLKGFDMESHQAIIQGVENFLESGDYRLGPSHHTKHNG